MQTILYLITQSELGGAQRYCFDLAANLKDKYNVIIALGEQGEAGELAKKLKETRIKYFAIPRLKRAISPINDFLALLEIIKLIKKIKPDIVHLNSSKISILGALGAFIANLQIVNQKSKIIYTVHGWVFNEPLPYWQKFFYKYAEKITAYFKNKIICVSEFDRQTALAEKIASPEKLITIHNGISPIKFLSKEEAGKKIKNYKSACLPAGPGIMNQEFIIGTVANLYKTKGLKYLIEAGKILKEKFMILIIGEGSERKNLEELIKKYGLEKKVILAGRINNAAELLPALDIYVCSSVKEGLSYTIIEAMQAGLPIVATNVGGNGELVENNKTGLLVETKNPGNLAEKIKELLDNTQLRKKLGKAAAEKAMAEYNLEQMVKKTEAIYESLLAQR